MKKFEMKYMMAALAISAVISSTPARACLGRQFERAIIHSELPTPLPENAIVAEVVIAEQPAERLSLDGLKARVTRWHQGGDSEQLILKKLLPSSCDHGFANGTTGIIVGVLREDENDIPVVEVFLARASNGFRGDYGDRVRTYSEMIEDIKVEMIRRAKAAARQSTMTPVD